MKYCKKCGTTKNLLKTGHHTHYVEIDGYDWVIDICKSCHVKLHRKLRKENKCPYTSKELHKFSLRAYRESNKCKDKELAYRQSERGKKISKTYKQTYVQPEKSKETRKRYNDINEIKIAETNSKYNKTAYKKIGFDISVDVNIILRELIRYNKNNDNVFVYSFFIGNNKRKMLYIDI